MVRLQLSFPRQGRLRLLPAQVAHRRLGVGDARVYLYLAVLRRLLKRLFTGATKEEKLDFGQEAVGRIGKVTAAIDPPKTGRVMIGDAEWTAEADAPVAVGTDVKVVSQNNLTLKVEVL